MLLDAFGFMFSRRNDGSLLDALLKYPFVIFAFLDKLVDEFLLGSDFALLLNQANHLIEHLRLPLLYPFDHGLLLV